MQKDFDYWRKTQNSQLFLCNVLSHSQKKLYTAMLFSDMPHWTCTKKVQGAAFEEKTAFIYFIYPFTCVWRGQLVGISSLSQCCSWQWN